MKKLLLLGGARYLIPVIQAAKNMGVYVITCDYLPNNVAHSFSDEYINASIVDKETILKIAAEKSIDGIMSFACDPGVVTAAYVAEKLNLPSVGSYESVCILQNKGRFRSFLRENGFDVPTSKSYKHLEEFLVDLDLFNWPIIIKPTDSAGSKGVTKVTSNDRIKHAVEEALKYSLTKEFIVEDFLEQKGHSSDCDFFTIDGKIVFSSFDCQWFDPKAENPYTPSAYTWPSSISLDTQHHLRSEIQRLVKLLNLGTSVFNVEVRECVNGKSYIMEFSPRGGGNRLSEMIRLMTGIDLISNAVKAALGVEIVDSFEEKESRGFAELILHSSKQGYFEGLDISESIKRNVVETDLWIKKGDYVGGFKGANEAIGTLVLKFDNQNDLSAFMRNVDEYVHVVVS